MHVRLAAVPWLLAAGVATAPSAQVAYDPASPQAAEIHGLSLLVLAIAAVIFLLTEGFLVYCIVRYRRRSRDAHEAVEPPQLYGSAPVEVAWTLLPSLIVFVIFLVVVRTTNALRSMPDGDPVHVTVVAHQWWWEYQYYQRYDDGRAPRLIATTANEMHVPTGRTVVVDLDSADVIHSFWVPRLNGKTDVIPGHPNQTQFEADSDDLYLGNCTEFCGTQHANMSIRVRSQPEQAYARWLAHQALPAAAPSGVEGRRGQSLFMQLACSNCHSVRGTQADGHFGPDLTHLMSRRTIAAGVITNDRSHLMDWLLHPQALKPGCDMPDMHLTTEQARMLTAYLETLH